MRLVLRVARSGIAFDPLPKHSMAGWLRALDFRSLRAYAGLLAVALWVAPSMAQETVTAGGSRAGVGGDHPRLCSDHGGRRQVLGQ
jgi:hypothetical protein